MAFLKITRSGVKLGTVLDGKRKFGRQPFGDPKLVKAIRSSVIDFSLREEIAKERGMLASGQVVPWKKPIPFPNRRSGPTLGGVSGPYGRAVRNAKVRASGLSLQMSIVDPHPGSLRTHLGGTGLRRTDSVLFIKPKTASPGQMAAAVSASTGTFISAKKAREGFKHHTRPFWGFSPQLQREVADKLEEAAANA